MTAVNASFLLNFCYDYFLFAVNENSEIFLISIFLMLKIYLSQQSQMETSKNAMWDDFFEYAYSK